MRALRNSQATAVAIASSGTATRSSTYCCTCANVISPARMFMMPSPMLDVFSSVTGWPASRAARIFMAPVGSTPTTRTPGRDSLMAVATPAISPPPPIGT